MYLETNNFFSSFNPLNLFKTKAYKVLALILILAGTLNAQDSLPQHYFINPLDIPISLAGTFGEIRTDHYHMGIDIRTDEKEGLAVHAAANGYISRIVASPS